MTDIERFMLPHLVDLKSFDPAVPIEQMAARAGMPVEDIIRLNANENPYGASPKVAKALSEMEPHIYPDPLQRKIRDAIGEYTEVDSSRIIAGAGSDELIDLLLRLFLAPGDKIIDCDPTFGMYSFCARIAGAEVVCAPRDGSFEIDVDAVRNAVDSRTKMVVINSPNNPTGNLASEDQLNALLDTGLVVLVDEAYYEFSGETFAPLVPEHENLIVLRTFSKWAGLAGLRVGYGFMSPTLVDRIIAMKSPYNVNSAAEVAAIVSLQDAELLMERVKKVVDERERLFSLLQGIEGIQPLPSGGNYVLSLLESGRVAELFEDLASRGIFLRRFGHERLAEYFRITVGTPKQTDVVVEALAELV